MTGLADSAVAPFAALATASLRPAVDRACARIAPTWPLDRFIAVNPYWGHLERPITYAAAQLAVLSGSPMLMPRRWYREQWRAGRIVRADLQAAIDAAGGSETTDQLVAALNQEAALPERLPLATDIVDARRDRGHAMAWRDTITHHISQCCAAYFDQGQAAWQPDRSGGLYPSWLRQSAHDLGPVMLMGYPGFSARLQDLPADPLRLIAAATQALRIPEAAHEAYFTALLMSINGWASWAAYRRWQARLVQADDDHIVQVLAVRLAWEWLLHVGYPTRGVADALADAWQGVASVLESARSAQAVDWLWQAALEHHFQQPLAQSLALARAVDSPEEAPAGPTVQAVFCIDVRSEVYRRALEASSPQVQTLGFAGFFAMFIAYRPLGTAMVRPQLPGLLAPGSCITDESDAPGLAQVLVVRRSQKLQWLQSWKRFRSGGNSAFSFVESTGLAYAGQLLKSAWGRGTGRKPVEQTGLPAEARRHLRPRLPTAAGPVPAARVDAAANALTVMGLNTDLARLVLLVGHGSSSTNNPHAAGLDCGACGGQTGEVNARVIASLLNDPAVRQGLSARGIVVPAGTGFVGCLHNTTTDEVTLFDTDLLPLGHTQDLHALQCWLADAGHRARAERAASLGLAAQAEDTAALARSVKARTTDWAQVRPEWGLAGCAAFIVAPRSRSRHLNLHGRSFLHDYAWQRDAGFKVLELIMTAPMVVTNWINLQYHASTVDNPRYGSGNKVLHNVVGGNLGVFEGNGGDLRIGLPLQSLHDGRDFRHTPLRLSVFIQAPQAAIDDIVARQDTVRHLIDHGWLHLFRLGDDAGVWRFCAGRSWQAVSS